MISLSEGLEFEWIPGTGLSCNDCLNPIATPNESTVYTLIVTDEKGCEFREDISIILVDDNNIFVPNIFSPDGDSNNDVFTVFSNSSITQVIEMNVYDRWGNLVFNNEMFEPGDLSQGWDGTINNRNAEPGVYVYTIKIVLPDTSERLFTGNLTLVK